MAGENCSSKCLTRDHATFGECMRAKGVRVGQIDATREKKFNSETEFARSAMEAGIMPDNCTRPAVERALAKSEKDGVAYRSDTRPDLNAAREQLGLTPMTKKQILENA